MTEGPASHQFASDELFQTFLLYAGRKVMTMWVVIMAVTMAGRRSI